MKSFNVCGLASASVLFLTLNTAYGVEAAKFAALPGVTTDPQATDKPAVGGIVEPRPGDARGDQLGGWYLGVYGDYTPTGLVLTHVYAGTAAAKVGLEVGDCIVTVNGHQIGIVLNRRVNLDATLQKTRSGWVRLLVQDHRTEQLVNMDVRLTRGRVHT